ncbi:hypothetical protein HYT32_00365 [Candidatus Roizmanbacteria bacterium]|nr:hypothetical protein [Candidatus Roizmanbacteria bacterium]
MNYAIINLLHDPCMVEQITYEFIPKNEPMISPKSLLEDNRSEEATRLRQAWDEIRREGKITLYFTCGDARILTPSPEGSIAIRTIAGGGLKDPYINLVNNRGVEKIVVLDHHDGDTVKPGQKPTGCGGLAAKEISNGHKGNETEEGIAEYIDHEVKHPDVIIQALLTAEEIALHTKKPVMAATQDHLTKIIYPLAIFLEGGLHKLTSIHLNDIAGDLYDPSRLYADGVPVLPDNLIPPNFRKLIEANREEAALLIERYPDLRQEQKVQNPEMVVMSTDVRSMRVRYPNTSRRPGSLFKLNIPRKKEGPHMKINQKDLVRTLNQAQYPIEHTVANFGDPTKPFSKTYTVFIETGDMELSRNLSKEIVKKPWMQEWIELPDRQIIVASTQAGVTKAVEIFQVP